MTRRVLAATILGAAAWLMLNPVDAWAFGGKGKYSGGGCGTGAPAYVSDGCAAPCAPPPMPYMTHTVTRYRSEMHTRQVAVTRMQMVPVTQEYTYTVMTPVTTTKKVSVTEYKQVLTEQPYTYMVNELVTTPEKIKVTENTVVTTEQPYTYMVNELVTTPEKIKVTENTVVNKEEAFTYFEMVAVTKPEKHTVTYTVCVPVQVTEMVPVTHVVSSPCAAPMGGCGTYAPVTAGYGGGGKQRLFGGKHHASSCGGCASAAPVCNTGCGSPYAAACHTVTEHVAVTRTVMQPTTRTEEVTVNVTTWQRVEKKGTRTVATIVPVTKDVTVNVTRSVAVEKKGTRTVATVVPTTREVEVPVTTLTPTTRTGTRTVMVCQPITQMVTQTYCVMVPYTETVQVAVGGGYGGCGYAAPTHGFGGGCCR